MNSQAQGIDPVHVQNVVSVILEATPDELEAGKLWYSIYAENIVNYGKLQGLTADQSLALFAVLSQRAKIGRNWSNFKIVASSRSCDGTVCVFGQMRTKCLAILADDAHPWRYVGGDKITSFYRNLSGNPEPVTFDRHAISAVYNQMIDQVNGHAQYAYCEHVFWQAAAIVGLTPRQTQAVAWVVWRRLKGVVDKEEAA